MGRAKTFDEDAAVAAARDLFWRNGYAATTPADLVGALGIGKGSLYNAFESKHALFEQALRRYSDERVAGLRKALARPNVSAKARIEAALERLAAAESTAARRRGCMATNSIAELGAGDEAVATIVRHAFARMEHVLEQTIEEGQAAGEISGAPEASALASLLLSTLVGMAVLGRLGDAERLRRVVAGLMALL